MGLASVMKRVMGVQPQERRDCNGEHLAEGDKCILLDGGPMPAARGMTITIMGWTKDNEAVMDLLHPEPPEVWVIDPKDLEKKIP